ncbi:VanZ family protein [Modestobacter sp. I12A-02662]|uniref:VanZ family protein n=1 Tax=Modestobacter sp. I12A-02662 TaxID=1730496 RepID=UPI0034E028F1
MASPLQPHGALSRGAFAVAVLISLAVLFAPPSDVPPSPYGIDKLVHGLLFAVLALTGRWAGVGRGGLAGLLVLYAAVSEIIQSTDLVNRNGSVADLVADVTGVLVGLLVWERSVRRRRASV